METKGKKQKLIEGTSTEETGWRGSPALLLVAVGGIVAMSRAILSSPPREWEQDMGSPFRPKASGLAGAPKTLSPRGEDNGRSRPQ